MTKSLFRLSSMIFLLATQGYAQEKSRSVDFLWLAIPEHHWALLVQTKGFELQQNGLTKNSRGGWSRHMQATNSGTGMIASAFIEEEKGQKYMPDIIKDEWPESRKREMHLSDFKLIEQNGTLGVEYMVKNFQGHPINQKGMHFYWIKDNCWMELHLSKVLFKPGDEALFQNIYKSAKIMFGSDPKTVMLTINGSRAYLAKNYQATIDDFQKVVDHEKTEPSLDKNVWRVVVDNLGMSYGMTSNLKQSVQTYQDGISADPAYPNFHYSLACAYAEMGKLDPAIENLKAAFQFKQNVLPGESMPDPSTDDSFKRYRSNAKFKRALKELAL